MSRFVLVGHGHSNSPIPAGTCARTVGRVGGFSFSATAQLGVTKDFVVQNVDELSRLVEEGYLSVHQDYVSANPSSYDRLQLMKAWGRPTPKSEEPRPPQKKAEELPLPMEETPEEEEEPEDTVTAELEPEEEKSPLVEEEKPLEEMKKDELVGYLLAQDLGFKVGELHKMKKAELLELAEASES